MPCLLSCIHRLRRPALGLLFFGSLVGCDIRPAPARAPLREQLATPDTPTLERAIVGCFEQTGWTIDSIHTASDGTRVVAAVFERGGASVGVAVRNGQAGPRVGFRLDASRVELGIQAPGTTPRITGDGVQLVPADVWGCLSHAPLEAPALQASDEAREH
jgi:hypothetical protein